MWGDIPRPLGGHPVTVRHWKFKDSGPNVAPQAALLELAASPPWAHLLQLKWCAVDTSSDERESHTCSCCILRSQGFGPVCLNDVSERV